MVIDKEEHRALLLELLQSPGLMIPATAADLFLEVRNAVRDADLPAARPPFCHREVDAAEEVECPNPT